jgi:hypothetical protein
MVVFASGIVDEGPPVGVVVPQYCQLAGVEPGAVAVGGGVGTLLGPEGSGIPVRGRCWCRVGWGWVSPCGPPWWVLPAGAGGVWLGGFVV